MFYYRKFIDLRIKRDIKLPIQGHLVSQVYLSG